MGDDVSRETPPDNAATLFGPRIRTAQAYADLLTTAGLERGLIGPREVPRIWNRHILNCAVAVDLVPPRATVCDVGSGAGLPGIVWAIRRPDVAMTLVEPLLRRSTFLVEAVEELELSNTTVMRVRAEELRGSMLADVVTARAVAPLDRLARLVLPLVRPGGLVLALKGESAPAELADASATLRRLGVVETSVEQVGEGFVEPLTTVVRLIKGKG